MRVAASWHVNEGLLPLINQMEDLYPHIVIGTIGDNVHSKEVSDHNPNKYGRVNAADFMLDSHFTESRAIALLPWLIKDPRTHYVIHDRKIWTSETKAWKAYTEKDPHTDHVHLSVLDSAYHIPTPWNIGDNDMPTAEEVWDYQISGQSAHGYIETLFKRIPPDLVGRMDALKSAVASLETQVDSLIATVEELQTKNG